jgi:hypothetical protein
MRQCIYRLHWLLAELSGYAGKFGWVLVWQIRHLRSAENLAASREFR